MYKYLLFTLLLFCSIPVFSQNKDQIIEFYVNNKERFEDNKRKIVKILDLVNDDYEFFKNLI